jgi:hypothetical protein
MYERYPQISGRDFVAVIFCEYKLLAVYAEIHYKEIMDALHLLAI